MNSINSFKKYADQYLGKSDQRRLKELMNKINVARGKRGDPIEEDMPKIKIKLLNDECMPVKKHRWDAGWDLKTTEDVMVVAGTTVKVHTGVIFEVPPRHMGMVVARSGLGTKHKVTLANDVGVIDSEYRGEILVFLSNDSDEDFSLSQYDRFAQIVIVPINTDELWKVTQVSETGRGDGGFGSTGLTSGRLNSGGDDTSTDSAIIADNTRERDKGMSPTPIQEAFINKITEKTLGVPEPTEEDINQLLNNVEESGITPITALKPSEYAKLKNSGRFWEVYPEATGIMKEDLNLGE